MVDRGPGCDRRVGNPGTCRSERDYPPIVPVTTLVRIAFLILASLLLGACSVAPSGDFRVGWFPAKLSGDIALDASSGGRNLSVVRADVEEDLGLGRSGNIMVGADLDTPIGRISGTYFRYSDHGVGTLSKSFGDIPPGTSVETDVAIDNVKAFWSFDLVDTGVVRLAPGAGLTFVAIDATVRSITALSAYERVAVSVPMPMLFLEGEVELGSFRGEVEAGWMSLDVGTFDSTFYDLDARVNWVPTAAMELFGGYRWVTLESDGRADGQLFDANLELEGFYFGGGLRF